MSDAIYLDHAATSWPKPPEVREETIRALTDLTANAGRSGHAPAVSSARLVFETREALASLLGIARSESLVFTRGTTEGLNLVLSGFLRAGDRVAITPMEHNSMMRPLETLRRERGITVEVLPSDPFGRIDPEAARRLGRDRKYALVGICHASNVNGIVQDLAGLRDAFADSAILVDAAQSAGVLPIDVDALGVDFLAFSAHKGLLGPTGVGACFLSARHEIDPLVRGGTGSRSDSTEHPDIRPDRYEAGTLNLHGIAGLSGALRGIPSRGLLGEHKRRLVTRLLDRLASIDRVRLHSPRDGTALCASISVDGMPPEAVALRLEREHGILVRPGLQCAPTAHRLLGTVPTGAIRVSPGWGNSDADVDAAAQAIADVVGSVESGDGPATRTDP
jgi:cysteine desulfurase family protein